MSAFCEQEADKLAKEVTEKLEEAEEQCRESLQAEWEECRPCLEDTCKNFYASTCRRGFATFHAKAGKPAQPAAILSHKTVRQEQPSPGEIKT